MRDSSVAESSPIQEYLGTLHQKYAGLQDGAVATYIPELAKADPNWFGICLVTVAGTVYEVGDSRQPFTIQSISKPFVYGLALEDNTRADVLNKVGVEPTGDAFNSISLDPTTGRPRNPMINAGAIATAGLIAGKTPAIRLSRILKKFSQCAGRELAIDENVYRSENETGHRNRAIGHMLRNFNILTDDPTPTVELYFQQCSILVTCRDLAVMAATLANRGVNPVTGEQAMRGEYVESVLSVMGSCGMYDFAGEWIYNIGIPAKSGVAGGLIAVLPGQLGIGVFSPLLDPHGNTVRGIKVCNDLSRDLDLHLFSPPNPGKAVIRHRFTGAEFSSNRIRSAEESQRLRKNGRRIKIYRLQGSLYFATAEVVTRDVMESMEETEFLILDLKRVLSTNESACRLLYRLFTVLFRQNTSVVLVHTGHLPTLRRYLKAKMGADFEKQIQLFEDADLALEWCENRLLTGEPTGDALLPRSEYELFQGLTPAELAAVEPLLERRKFARGETIIHVGAEACEMYLLARGNVSVFVPLGASAHKRVATLCPGMAFGEMAVIDGAPRSATIIADTETECDLLSVETLDRLVDTNPRIKIKLLNNLCLGFSRKLRKANQQLSVLD